MDNNSQDIIALITQYTSELESLDQLNNTYIMTCVGFIGVILGIIVTLISIRNAEKAKKFSASINKLISILFMSIPIIACIYIGVTTINCRKVAIYRSYLVYLEEAYNRIPNVVFQKFNTKALSFLSKWSPSNTNGSMMNAFVVFVNAFIVSILMIACFIMAFVFFNKSRKCMTNQKRKWTKTEYIICGVFIMTIVLCAIISAISIYDLCINDVNINKILYYLNS